MKQNKQNKQNVLNEFNTYTNKIEGFCPFVNPSKKSDFLYNIIIDLTDINDFNEVEELIFYNALLYTEKFRNHRRNLKKNKEKLLLCYNLIFIMNDELSEQGEKLLAWPHWILKKRLTKYGIMFGKFWKDEEIDSLKGIPIDKPPFNFMSIRSAVTSRDPEFLHRFEDLKNDLILSEDNGELLHYIYNQDLLKNLDIQHLKHNNVFQNLKNLIMEGRL